MSEAICRTVIELVARHYGTDPPAILSDDRHRSVLLARHAAIYVSWLAGGSGDLSYAEIGRAFGRDHSSIMNACQRMAQRSLALPEFGKTVDLLVQQALGLGRGFVGTPVRVRAELLQLIRERMKLGLFGHSVEDVVDRILCDHFQRDRSKNP